MNDRPSTRASAGTYGELRSTRRWLAVAAVWAVAATALAVFALIEANKEDEAARTQAAGELGRVQRELNAGSTTSSRASTTCRPPTIYRSSTAGSSRSRRRGQDGTDIERLGNRLDDLETRVDELEQAQQQQDTTTTP